MKALKYIGLLLLTLLALFLVLGLVSTKKVHLERTTLIKAPVSTVQDVVRRFSTQKAWNPWQEYDPEMKVTLEGEDGSVGSKYSWSGNKDVGKGYQMITNIAPDYVGSELVFEEPWSSKATIGMKLTEEDGATRATWSFDSETPFPWNAMNLFMNMDKLLGPDFEKGLNKLKTYIETEVDKKYRGYTINESEHPARFFVGMRKTVAIPQITSFFAEQFGKIYAAIQKAGIEMDGMPAGLYFTYDETAGTTDMVAGIPVKGKASVPGFSTFEIPAGTELSLDYFGAYDKMGEAHYAMEDYIREKALTGRVPVIEEYLSDPELEPDTAKWLTRVIYPVSK
ncbi:MAG TPA: SRPBCC family protein [Saprospiraceae bacterium]|nr:SRPBCC family protein [Saprospiraceae bacterium]HNT20296.1 SRPBCC family protein [Saprospiraceae bacterium]